jgi:recombination protein RecA
MKGKREDEYRERSKISTTYLDKLDKTYKGTVMKMGDKAIVEVETISSDL